MNWSTGDYVLAAALILAMILGILFTVIKVKKRSQRIVVILSVIAIFALVWAELAIGIFH